MADEIVITAKVSDDATPKLRQLRDEIERVKNTGGGSSTQLDQLKKHLLDLTNAGRHLRPSFREGEDGAHGLIEGLHAAQPILERLGLGIGNLRGFSAAAALGLGGLGAAAGGAALAGLAKLNDETITAQKRFAGFFQNTGLANKVFQDLEARAKVLGTDVGTLSGPLEKLQTAAAAGSTIRFRAVPGQEEALPGVQNYKKQADALQVLFEAMRTGGATDEQAAKGLDQFTDALKRQTEQGEKAHLTVQMVQDLAAVAPGAANALAHAFGKQSAIDLEQALRGGLLKTIDQLVPALGRVKAANDAAFADPKKNAKGFSDAVSDLTTSLKGDLRDLTGKSYDEFIAGQIEGVKRIAHDTVPEIQAIIAAVKTLNKLSYGDLSPLPKPLADFLGVLAGKGMSPGKQTSVEAATGASPETGIPFAAAGTAGPPEAKPTDTGAAAPLALADQGPTPEHRNRGVTDRQLMQQGVIPLGRMMEYEGYPRGTSAGGSGGPENIGNQKALRDAIYQSPAELNRPWRGEAPEPLPKGPLPPMNIGPNRKPNISIGHLDEQGHFVPFTPATPGGFAKGGSTSDAIRRLIAMFAGGGQIPARVSNDEHFVDPETTARVGLPFLDALNALGHADGGRIRGAGTSKSDSIFTLLPEGGYVINAAARAQVGSSFLDNLRHLADGGRLYLNPDFVSGGEDFGPSPKALSSPSFAAAPPPASSSSSAGAFAGRPKGYHVLELKMGGESFGRGYADDDVVAALQRATSKDLASRISRPPSSVG